MRFIIMRRSRILSTLYSYQRNLLNQSRLRANNLCAVGERLFSKNGDKKIAEELAVSDLAQSTDNGKKKPPLVKVPEEDDNEQLTYRTFGLDAIGLAAQEKYPTRYRSSTSSRSGKLDSGGSDAESRLAQDGRVPDFITQKMNEVLKTQGFAPPWIELDGEIRKNKLLFQQKLAVQVSKYGKIDQKSWTDLESDVLKLNHIIQQFNLVVPILSKQMMTFGVEREAKKMQELSTDQLQQKMAKISKQLAAIERKNKIN